MIHTQEVERRDFVHTRMNRVIHTDKGGGEVGHMIYTRVRRIHTHYRGRDCRGTSFIVFCFYGMRRPLKAISQSLSYDMIVARCCSAADCSTSGHHRGGVPRTPV